ncbi:MAG: DNA-deoxyinosine glycosylase [Candidatus Riflebacteria bacterium]|nr:DNA-deoxyinosine glycosylase [Candidatus Riflebacteria bacterium]
MKIKHPFEAVYNKDSKILILGSFPSVKSREQKFFYGHPQNRFWKVISEIFKENVPQNIKEKKTFLLKNKIALWDVIANCEIEGSSDSSITNAVPNDLSPIFKCAKIEKVYCNGTKSFELYQKYIFPQNNIKAEKLPSTSPANAAWTLEKLIKEWKSKIFQQK